jgi:hypothetical protein
MTGIDPRVLTLAKGLSMLAYTGVILVLPPLMAAKAIQIAERVTAKIIGESLLTWAEDILDNAVDSILGEVSV